MGDEYECDEFSKLHDQWLRCSDKLTREKFGPFKSGRWTPDELELLRNNVEKFIEKHKVSDLRQFIFDNKRGERSTFYRNIAVGVRRPLFHIYRKVICLYDINNYVGKWTRKKEKKLLRLHSVHGNKWATIGKCLGTSGRAAHDKYRNITKRENKGPWTPEEECKLTSALKNVTEPSLSDDTLLPPTVTWVDIAESVGTRNAAQCRSKWVNMLSWQERGGVRRWNECDDVKLLHILSSLSVDNEDDIDWSSLCDNWESARSGFFLRVKWSGLRRTVPRYNIKMYQDNLDYLLEHRLPALEISIKQKYSSDSSN